MSKTSPARCQNAKQISRPAVVDSEQYVATSPPSAGSGVGVGLAATEDRSITCANVAPSSRLYTSIPTAYGAAGSGVATKSTGLTPQKTASASTSSGENASTA